MKLFDLNFLWNCSFLSARTRLQFLNKFDQIRLKDSLRSTFNSLAFASPLTKFPSRYTLLLFFWFSISIIKFVFQFYAKLSSRHSSSSSSAHSATASVCNIYLPTHVEVWAREPVVVCYYCGVSERQRIEVRVYLAGIFHIQGLWTRPLKRNSYAFYGLPCKSVVKISILHNRKF